MAWVVVLLVLALLALLVPRLALMRRYADSIVTPSDAPPRATAIVFGAGLRRDGTPTQVLADRVAAAAGLYQRGIVQALFLRGSTRGTSYDEAEAMRKLALELGVEPDAILLDRLGTRTAPMYRAPGWA